MNIYDYVVAFNDGKIAVTYKDTDITADVIGKSPAIDSFIASVVRTIDKCDTVLENNKKYIADAWKHIDALKAQYKSLTNK